MVNLSKVEEQILNDLYDRDIENDLKIKIEHERYNLLEEEKRYRTQELVYYIGKLEKLGFIQINKNERGKFYASGGKIHPQYKNNALMDIDDANIYIIDKGIEHVVESKKTSIDKIKGFTKETGIETVKEIIKYIAIFAVGILLGKLIGS